MVFVRYGERFAAVQKARRIGYVFSGLWALPGGMIRLPRGCEASLQQIEDAIRTRVRAETNLALSDLSSVQLGPIVTRYVAKGRPRLTLVGALHVEASSLGDLLPGDPSIQAAAWIAVPPKLATFAPANQLILAHLLWPDLTVEAREQMEAELQRALEICVEVAACAGIARPEPPWADANDLDLWRDGWPGG